MDPAKPPDKETLLKADPIERQQLYSDAWYRQLGVVNESNARFGSLQEWKEKQIEAEKRLSGEDDTVTIGNEIPKEEND